MLIRLTVFLETSSRGHLKERDTFSGPKLTANYDVGELTGKERCKRFTVQRWNIGQILGCMFLKFNGLEIEWPNDSRENTNCDWGCLIWFNFYSHWTLTDLLHINRWNISNYFFQQKTKKDEKIAQFDTSEDQIASNVEELCPRTH